MPFLPQAKQLLSSLLSRKHNQLIRLHFPRGDGPLATLVANRLAATEQVSKDFMFSVEVLSEDPAIELKTVLGKMATITLTREGAAPRYFNGYVTEMQYQSVRDGLAVYEMTLSPWLSFLRLRRDNHLFHGTTVEAQTEAFFADYPEVANWTTRALGDDPVMTDACQFDETDYNYLHRRWEALGWHYWYEHSETGHQLVLSGDSTLSSPIDGPSTVIPLHDKATLKEDNGLVHFSTTRRAVPSAVTTASFDFKAPRPVRTEATTINQQGKPPALEVYEYTGAYGFANRGDGEAQARLRMEEIEANAKHFEAVGNHRGVLPGRWFTLMGLDDDSLLGTGAAGEREFFILNITHLASNNYDAGQAAAAIYQNRFTCQRKRLPWRPGRSFNSVDTRIYGLQTAIVVGPEGAEIHSDEYGRVKIQFHWDRHGQYDDKSSAWVRVASTWAGANFGFIAIPRIGQEVLVQFLDGNPDRPLITGRVYNAANMPPWELPANQTQTGILTRSSKGGGYDNANAIRFEDKKGEEQLWLHAEKDQLTEVENDEDKWVGNDRRKTVDGNETTVIHKNRTETVDLNESVHIGHNRSVTIEMNKAETIGLAKAETIGLAKALTIGTAYQQTVGIAKNVTIGNTYSINVGDELSITVGKSTLVMKSDGTITMNGHTFSLGTTGEQTLKADGTITLKGQKILEN
jgi:type VI secretion system secreted protein VgrG